MGYTIAVCGKGGTGKTTISSLIIRWLADKTGAGSILAVDADPNVNLYQNLGVGVGKSIVGIVDNISRNPGQIPPGMTKDRYLEYQIQDALVEEKKFDLLVMGRPEGPGCYCFVNNLLRTLIEKLSGSYRYLVIDNEAGMEHLSRRTTMSMDLLLIVSDCTIVGLRSAKRILDLTKELNLDVKKAALVLNRARGDISVFKDEISNMGIPLAGVIPDEDMISLRSLEGNDLISLPGESMVVKAVNKICEENL